MNNREYYEKLLKEHGHSHKATGFHDIVSQEVRYECILKNVPLSDRSLLDVGCGTGGFLKWVFDKPFFVPPSEYMGIDVLPEMILAAKELFLEEDEAYAKAEGTKVNYRCVDVSEIEGEWDVGICCAAFCIKEGTVDNTWEIAQRVWKAMWERCREAVAIDFISPLADSLGDYYAPIPHEWALKFAKSLSKKVVLDFSYAPHSYTIVIYKKPNRFECEWRG